MASTIGIKIANGEFYSIIEENSAVKKRLILTTVHDNQQSVQIDLYRSNTQAMSGARYIGSLVVENINPKLKGEPSIELVISSAVNGDIIADAIDLDTSTGGEHQILSVSLKSLDETGKDIPDFELEQNEEPPSGLYKHAKAIRKDEEEKRFPWLPVIIIGMFIILALLAVWFFLFGGKEQFSGTASKPRTEQSAPAAAQPAQSPPAQPAQPARPAQPAQEAQPARPSAPVIQAPSSAPPVRPQVTGRTRPPAPVLSYKVPATIPREGVPYKIRWGDTLWDISNAFYRNPWLYPRIARFNNIRNPNLIISGTTIRIPPKN